MMSTKIPTLVGMYDSLLRVWTAVYCWSKQIGEKNVMFSKFGSFDSNGNDIVFDEKFLSHFQEKLKVADVMAFAFFR